MAIDLDRKAIYIDLLIGMDRGISFRRDGGAWRSKNRITYLGISIFFTIIVGKEAFAPVAF